MIIRRGTWRKTRLSVSGSSSFWTGQIPQSTNLYLCGQDHWDGYVVGENLPYGGW
jgi:hypothetical protein